MKMEMPSVLKIGSAIGIMMMWLAALGTAVARDSKPKGINGLTKAAAAKASVEQVEIKEGPDLNEGDVPAKDPTKTPSTKVDRTKTVDVKDDPPMTDGDVDPEDVLDVVKVRAPVTLTYKRNRLGDRRPAGRRKVVAKYGGSKAGQNAVGRALHWLAKVQNDNGSWGDPDKKTFSDEPGHPAHTGLALLVFLGRGETPLSLTHGKTIQKAMRWLAEYGSQPDLKKIVKKKHGAYTHGIATLALAESYAMTKIPFLQGAMDNCVVALIHGQMKNGGFGYAYSQGQRWDLSVSSWNIQALKAAEMAGSAHPQLKDAINKSLRFCALAYGGKGEFSYTPRDKKQSMVGIGTLSLQILGAGSDRPAAEGCARIVDERLKAYEEVMKDPAKWKTTGSKCLYGWYYDTQAIFNAMGPNSAEWKRWRKAFESVLVKAQHKEGYWETVAPGTGPNTPGRVLSTCWAALQLQVYYRYSPYLAVGKVQTPELKKKVEILIQQLGAEGFKERKAARKELLEMGRSVYTLLAEGLKTDDPEIKHALQEIMKALANE